MYSEEEFIVISALQHYMFCPRQCALIHVEDAWIENVFTARGRILHERVDTDTYESRGTLRTVRGLRIHSYELGIVGRADVVEFRKSSDGIGGVDAVPVEFKAGQPKPDERDEVQLCAQALCLEEMLTTEIRRGVFFYGKIRRRVEVDINDNLRERTRDTIGAVRDIVSRGVTPPARYNSRCRNCSLIDICQPKAMNDRKLRQYVSGLYLT